MIRDFAFEGGPAAEAGAREWLAAGSPARSEPRPASTVMLLRDRAGDEGTGGPEVVMLRRASTMAFAASMHAFPGGGVDAADHDSRRADLPDRIVSRVARAMGATSPEERAKARAHLGCAVREIEEECGIVLDPADLVVRERWVTPGSDRRRFDAWIFAARLPADHVVTSRTSEAETMDWVRPEEVLAGLARGTVKMMPPTIHSLERLAAAGSVALFLAEPPHPGLIAPSPHEVEGRIVIRAVVPDPRPGQPRPALPPPAQPRPALP